MKTLFAAFLGGSLAGIFITTISVLLVLWQALALLLVWNLALVPLGLPELTVLTASGITLVRTLLLANYLKAGEKKADVLNALLIPPLIVAIAYTVAWVA